MIRHYKKTTMFVSTKYNVLVEIAPGSSLSELKLHLEIVIST
jgi:hypothetical protein